ncbi:MAG: hypothetical protein HKN24_14965, partial [Acidimicrobiales bacterium]|nr:hypothetical protein [Acidimicrobiales bacterium]
MTEATRSRLRRDQLKALVLDAGVQLLHEDGIAAKTAPLGYADAFRWLQEHRGLTVSRAQVHRRIWNSLAAYRDDVMTNVVKLGFPKDVLHGTEANAAEALEQLPIDEADGEQRVTMLCEMARALTDLNAEALRTRPAIAAADALFLMHALGTNEETTSPAVQAAIVANKNEILDAYVDLYDQIGVAFDLTAGGDWAMSHDDGLRMFAEVISCLNHGAAGRSSFDPSLQELQVGGEFWSVEALGVYAIVGHVASLN